MRLAALIVSILFALPAQGQLMGPLRLRDMTPFNILRLDMPPAPVVQEGWQVEAVLSRTNVFMMSDNVKEHLGQTDAIAGLGEDFYFVDGEIGLLDLSFQYGHAYLRLSVYDYTGGFLDSTVDGFHDSFGFGDAGRDLVARDRFQAVASLDGRQIAVLTPPPSGLGDPVIGVRWPFEGPRWTLILDGAAKISVRDERSGLSTGSNDFGVQASLQRKLGRQGFYLNASLVRTDGKVFGVPVGNRVVPTLTAAYEVGLTRRTNAVLQLYASESAILNTSIDEIKANKYQASLGLRSRQGRLIYGFAVTENLVNFQNTPDIGLSLMLGWMPQSSSSP